MERKILMIDRLRNLNEGYFLGLVLGIVGVLQASRLSTYSFWFDESYTDTIIKFSVRDMVHLTANDVHPPLYYLILKGWAAIFGNSDTALRSLSAIFMLASLILLYYLVKKLLNADYAKVALIFAGLGPFVIRYSAEARMYGLSSMLILAASLVLVSCLVANVPSKPFFSRKRVMFIAGYSVLIAMVLYTHYFASLIVPVHGLYLLARSKGSLKQRLMSLDRGWLMALGVSFVAYLPWVPTLRAQLSAVNSGFWIPGIREVTLPDTVGQLLAFYPISRDLGVIYTIAGYLGLLGLIGASYYAVKAGKLKLDFVTLTVGSVAVVSTILIILSILPGTSSYYYLRYFAQYSVLFYGGLGALSLALYRRKAPIGLIFGALVISLQIFGVSRVLSGVDKVNNQSNLLVGYVNENYEPGDVFMASRYDNYYDAHHYNQTGTKVVLNTPEENYGSLLPIREAEGAIVSFESVSRPGTRIWYLSGVSNGIEVPDNWLQVRRLEAEDTALELYIVQ